MKKRKGTTMIEAMATIMCIAIIIAGVAATSMVVQELSDRTKNIISLSNHNLNVMERLRQDCLNSSSDLLSFYGDENLGSLSIETNAYLEKTSLDHFTVYSVRIESKMRDSKLRLNSEYVMTNIGGVSFGDALE